MHFDPLHILMPWMHANPVLLPPPILEPPTSALFVLQTSPPAAFKAVSVTVIDSPGGKPLFDIGRKLKPLREYLLSRPADKEYVVSNRAVPLGGGVYQVRACEERSRGRKEQSDEVLRIYGALTTTPWTTSHFRLALVKLIL